MGVKFAYTKAETLMTIPTAIEGKQGEHYWAAIIF
jgi:hypothetical protein